MNIEQKAITLIKEIEKRHHTPSQVMASASFEQELMEEKIELVKKFAQEILYINYIPTRMPVEISYSGEWCEKCGAWKQYGVADNHNCKGYKVTC